MLTFADKASAAGLYMTQMFAEGELLALGFSAGKTAIGSLRRVFPIRLVGNNWTLVRRNWLNGIRWFWDDRSYNAVRTQYWRVSGGANGQNLHHWLFPQRWEWIPQGLRNAGLNLVELPGGFNQWLGRGLTREIKELGFRLVFGHTEVASTLVHT